MHRMTRQKLANFFGALGYIALTLQWSWALILLLPPLLQVKTIRVFTMPQSVSHVHASHSSYVLPWWLTVVFVALAFIIVIVGIFYAVKTPVIVAREAKRTTEKTAKNLAHRVVKTPRNTREVRLVSARLVWALKGSAVLVGFILTFIAAYFVHSLPGYVTVIVGVYLVSWSLLWFGLQYFIEPCHTLRKNS